MADGSAARRPEDVIGSDAVMRLEMAGFEISRRPQRDKFRARFTCPHCGYSSFGGRALNVHAEWGEAWHYLCVPPPAPSNMQRRDGESDRLPMVKTYELIEATPSAR